MLGKETFIVKQSGDGRFNVEGKWYRNSESEVVHEVK